MVGDEIEKARSNDPDEGRDVLWCFNQCPTNFRCGEYEVLQRILQLTILRRNEREYVRSRIEKNGILRVINEASGGMTDVLHVPDPSICRSLLDSAGFNLV